MVIQNNRRLLWIDKGVITFQDLELKTFKKYVCLKIVKTVPELNVRGYFSHAWLDY